MQVNQPTIKACVADILPKQGVQVPESVTQSMDNALSLKDEFDLNELRKGLLKQYYASSDSPQVLLATYENRKGTSE
ncbi:Chromatin assembly factor 1 subunit A [Artemisia annua]|uniref:Chromatin assembly factor 1 subunit A n=1 Tax=Artemisia annua TaxID=35608 RepID=A0A2U1PT63_ARTAN|nr:Chromatin assembly factor 1 subunit A [Artemisia annua]